MAVTANPAAVAAIKEHYSLSTLPPRLPRAQEFSRVMASAIRISGLVIGVTDFDTAIEELFGADFEFPADAERTEATIKAEGLEEAAIAARAAWAPEPCPWVGFLDDRAAKLRAGEKV